MFKIEVFDAATGGAWGDSGVGDIVEGSVGDPLGDVLDMGEDILDGDLDDFIEAIPTHSLGQIFILQPTFIIWI